MRSFFFCSHFQSFKLRQKKKMSLKNDFKFESCCIFVCRTSLSLFFFAHTALIILMPVYTYMLCLHKCVNFHLCNTCAYIFQINKKAMCPAFLLLLPFLWPWPKCFVVFSVCLALSCSRVVDFSQVMGTFLGLINFESMTF